MRKIIALILVMMMLVSLCACGETAQPTEPKNDQTTTDAPTGEATGDATEAPTETPTEAPTEAPTAAPCSHNWTGASCTAGSTCTLCGAAGEGALGHSWTGASCTAANTCTRCGAVDGAALGHNRVDGTCQRCGNTVDASRDLWPGIWCIPVMNGNTGVRLDLVFGSPESKDGSIMVGNWSTDGYMDEFYHEATNTVYYLQEFTLHGQFTYTGDEYGMTLTVTTESGATGTITLDRVDNNTFKVIAVSGTILDAATTAMVTVGASIIYTDMYA